MTSKKRRTDRELWDAVRELDAEGSFETTKEEAERALEAEGFDAKAVAARGEKLARELLEKAGTPWFQLDFATLTRTALLAALEAANRDPDVRPSRRVESDMRAMRPADDEPSDDELRAMLGQLASRKRKGT